MQEKTLHLASGSPRRREILTRLGLRFTACGADIDETALANESVEAMVVRLAEGKALASNESADLILGADTAVTLNGRTFGKPGSEAEALDMLLALSGAVHTVVTGVALRSAAGVATALSRSKVRFRDIDPAEARKYWQCGEPCDKAGGYAIQGVGSVFVADIRGSYSGIVGLPVFETAALLKQAGVDVLAAADSSK